MTVAAITPCPSCGAPSSEDYDGHGSCYGCHVAALEAQAERRLNFGEPATTWAPQSLDEILAGGYVPPTPTMLARVDGRCLLYPERSHSVSAEPEALKTWLALGASAEQLAAGQLVLYVDFESSAAEIVGRLRALGVDPQLIRDRFMYLRPDEPLAEMSLADLARALDRKPSLTIIDGVTEAFNVQGLSPLDNADVATWLELLPRRIIRAGSVPLMLDHVVKDKEQRGRYAIGAQHKLAGVDVAYSMHVVEPFGRGRSGVVTIKVQKDRPGGVREFAQDGLVATLRATSHDDGRVSLALEPPEHSVEHEASFRPTGYMERVSKAVEADPGLSKRAIRTSVGGGTEYVDLALELLVSEGFVRVAAGPRNSSLHHSVRPYRDTVTPTVTDRDSDASSHGERDRDSVTSPLKGASQSRRLASPSDSDLDRDCDWIADVQGVDGIAKRMQRLDASFNLGADTLAKSLGVERILITSEPDEGGLPLEALLAAFGGAS